MELYKTLNKPRILTLDSLRGLAAVTVVAAHACGILINGHSLDEYTPLYLLRAAHESVIFFFLLSGYVLTYQIKNQQYFNYWNFLMQRVFRIYIPYFVVMTLVFILYIFFMQNKGDLQNKNWFFQPFPSSRDVAAHFFLVGNFDTNAYNNIIWTLVHEMRVAIIFPFLLFLLKFNTKGIITGLVCASLLVGLCIANGIDNSEGYNNSYLFTVHYFSFFVLGGLLVKHAEELSVWYLGLSSKSKKVCFLIMLFVFSYSRMLFLIPHKFDYLKISLFNEFVSDWLTALSAAFLIIYAIHVVNHKNILLSRFTLFLGKISYSLYLIHLPVILVGLSVFSNTNKIVVVLSSVFIGVILALFLNRYIEKPSGKLGKSFST
jgi:peptidoglycan/LPS O-acetylase OafA/YrhL